MSSFSYLFFYLFKGVKWCEFYGVTTKHFFQPFLRNSTRQGANYQRLHSTLVVLFNNGLKSMRALVAKKNYDSGMQALVVCQTV